jgi:mono/diheme cytochrome c family protein
MQAMPSSRFNDGEAKAIVDFVNYDEAHRKPSITPPASAEVPETASAGRKIYYAQGCDACHSIAGQGGPMPMDDVGTRLSRDQMMQRMRGRRAGAVMPPLPSDTTDQQINQLVDFLVTLKGK